VVRHPEPELRKLPNETESDEESLRREVSALKEEVSLISSSKHRVWVFLVLISVPNQIQDSFARSVTTSL
jgi:hypothetical protein